MSGFERYNDDRYNDDRYSDDGYGDDGYGDDGRNGGNGYNGIDSQEAYRFEFSGTSIRTVYQIEHGRVEVEHIDANESWTFDGTTVTLVKVEQGAVKTTTFNDFDGDGTYTATAASYDTSPVSGIGSYGRYGADDGQDDYRFEFSGNTVSNAYELRNGVEVEHLDPNENWTFNGSTVTRSQVERGIFETETYGDFDGDGVYTSLNQGYSSALFSGSRSEYAVIDDNGSIVVARYGEVGRVSNVENFTFDDHSYSTAEVLTAPVDADHSAYEVYRFFNTQNNTHFFTSSIEERDQIILNQPEYIYEHNAFDSNATQNNGGMAVHRFLNTGNGSHFYTANEDEAQLIRNTLPQFYDEGIAYYASQDASNGGTALYRFLNTDTGTHFYTTNEAERDNIISTLGNYDYEGLVYYVDFA